MMNWTDWWAFSSSTLARKVWLFCYATTEIQKGTWVSASISLLPTIYPPVEVTAPSFHSPSRGRQAGSSVCAAQPRTAWPWEADEVKYHCSVKANMSFDLECQLDAKEMWLEWPWSSSWLSPMQMCWSPWELQPERTANLESIMGSSHRLELKPCPTAVKKKQMIRKTPVFLIWLLRWTGE